jgi:NTP pyrophosphatase (non-canonical NTP hydrolase)
MIDLKEVQERILANKLAKGFATSNVEKEFNLTYAELAEAYEAYRKQHDNVGEELADVLIFVLSLAKMLDVDIEKALLDKLAKNEARNYKKLENGYHVQS